MILQLPFPQEKEEGGFFARISHASPRRFSLHMDSKPLLRKTQSATFTNIGSYVVTSSSSVIAIACLAVYLGEKGVVRSLVIFLELLAVFVLAISNGGNDIANAVGTSVGAKVLTMNQALSFGAGFEFMGAVLLGALVSKTISKGVIEPAEFASSPSVFAVLMFSVVVGSALTTLLATIYGYPISATHGIISGLVAVGYYIKGSVCIGWTALSYTLLMWVLSPIAGLVASFIIQLICSWILSLDLSSGCGVLMMPILWISTLTVTCSFMFATGPEAIRVEPVSLSLAVSLALGMILTMTIYLYRYCRGKKSEKVSSMMEKEADVEEQDISNPIEEEFTGLLVLSALTVAFAHGANDVGNCVGPLAVMMEAFTSSKLHDEPDVPMWCLLLGACGFVVGIIILGERTCDTVGKRIIKLTPSRSYATQMGAALAVLLSSVLGMPVSTSHCLVGSVLGVGLAQGLNSCVNGTEMPKINIGILNKILIGWAVTIPLAMIVALVVFYAARPFANHFSVSL
mmetsp:Transcript_18335/g.27452  ORF Transcript_18335/g.27452 Transcript_18335/m.27452 type:complete len:514 (+) Transcript_18335:2-1543(+)